MRGSISRKQRAEPMLRLNNVEVIYNKVLLVLRGVSLDVKPGNIAALLGANGAGKSTALKAISGLLKTELGEVTRAASLLKTNASTGKTRKSSQASAFGRSWKDADCTFT